MAVQLFIIGMIIKREFESNKYSVARASKRFDEIDTTLLHHYEVIAMIKVDYISRIERQEKLIAELKKNQLDPQSTEVVDIVGEWLNGAKE